MIAVTMVQAASKYANTESTITFDIKGKDVYNSGYPHRIVEFFGRIGCCRGEWSETEHLHMLSESIVIDGRPKGTRAQVTIGDEIEVFGEIWTLVAGKYHDPILIKRVKKPEKTYNVQRTGCKYEIGYFEHIFAVLDDAGDPTDQFLYIEDEKNSFQENKRYTITITEMD